MDLISAKVDAAKASKLEKTTKYVVSHSDGECTIENREPSKQGDVLQAVFVNGSEEKDAPVTTVPDQKGRSVGPKITPVKRENNIKTNKSNSMKTAKKGNGAKKSPATAKVKKDKGAAKLTRGNNMALTAEQWAKVDKARGEESFSSFSRGLVLKKIGE